MDTVKGRLDVLKTNQRLTGVEPASRAWEARVMPLYDSRVMVKTIYIDKQCRSFRKAKLQTKQAQAVLA